MNALIHPFCSKHTAKIDKVKEKRGKRDERLQRPELAMNYKPLSRFEGTSLFSSCLQAHGGSSHVGSYHIMGIKSSSCTVVDEYKAYCLQREAGMGLLPLQKEVY